MKRAPAAKQRVACSTIERERRRVKMAVFTVDKYRFDASAPPTESAENQRTTFAKHIIPDTRPAQDDNGDFMECPDKRGTFTKGLKHDTTTGLVDLTAFDAFAVALAKPRNEVFKALQDIKENHLGFGNGTRSWVSPVAGRAFSAVAGDPQQYGKDVMPPAPKFASTELSFEILENYWMALLRDVPFSQYEDNDLAERAAAELSVFHNSARAERGEDNPLAAVDAEGSIIPRLLFRGLGRGEDQGPYLSQFLIHPVPFGVQGFHQRNKTLRPYNDYMTTWEDWVKVQNGEPRDFVPRDFEQELHYLRNGRDLSQWVHIDVLFQAYFNACLQLLQGAGSPSVVGGGLGSRVSPVNPYFDLELKPKRQDGFAVLGGPEQIAMMCEVASLALRAVWFQKWYVHLRFRPEVYAGRIEYERRNPGAFGIPADLLGSEAISETINRYGSALLPMAFPEGSPMHPAYGAGHATVAGACVTILKALFKGDEKFPHPVDVMVDSSGNERLVALNEDLTIEGELNKLASNIALGRNVAGVHWRSDGTYSLLLGERVAIDLLKAYAATYAEFAPATEVFKFIRFDGVEQSIPARGM
jgi:hypothetical protein